MKSYVKNGVWNFPKWVEFYNNDTVKQNNINAKPINLKQNDLEVMNKYECINKGYKDYKLVIYQRKTGSIVGIVKKDDYMFYDYDNLMNMIKDPNREQLLELKRKVEKIIN